MYPTVEMARAAYRAAAAAETRAFYFGTRAEYEEARRTAKRAGADLENAHQLARVAAAKAAYDPRAARAAATHRIVAKG